MRAFVCACECVCVRGKHLRACLRVGVSNDCVCMPRRLCGRCGGTAGAGGINSSAGGAGRPRVRGVRFGAIGFRVMCASAAGRTFANRALKAEWAARYAHTSVVDAAGAIYVLGGESNTGYFQDVWASTDGGARAGLH